MDSFIADKVVDDCFAIIVEGFEYGRYWTMDEAPKDGGTVKPSIKLNNSAEEDR